MALLNDLKILYHLALSPIRGKTHAQRLESFYAGQAEGYDDFRKALLKGREQLWEKLPRPEGGIWVDMGGGTGANLEYFGDSISKLKKIYVVDLSTSLLKMARERAEKNGWDNVECVEADATTWVPEEGKVDTVTFSYSLTMIPDWFAAVEHAHSLLKEGGTLGVVDFYVSRKYAAEGNKQHGWSTRTFWPTWFSNDNVYPSPDHLPFIQRKFQTVSLQEDRAKVPYLPLIKTPYYTFVGKKQVPNQ
ncbi:S-adenosylmethionine-diacylgycerolhomoserine-N-methyltransferase [Planctomycetales bacterium 10988]|nr:S-adenosylmethionine-diacylgycerolhomoserine-N-methyltransferase [Planctomycetales bacterium 10988]